MTSNLLLGRLAGISVYVHWTFILLLGWVGFQGYSIGGSWQDVVFMLLLVIAVFACVTLHELGHSLAARRYGINTKKITLLPIGGVAQLEAIPEKPIEELIVAIAGPLVNIAIAISLFLVCLPMGLDVVAGISSDSAINGNAFVSTLILVNLMLVVFNAIPAFPMDGGRVLRSLLAMKLDRVKATRIAVRVGQLIAILFVFYGFYNNPFMVFIGIFVFMSAAGEDAAVRSESILAKYQVKELMRNDLEPVLSTETVNELVKRMQSSGERHFLVRNELDELLGFIDRKTLLETYKSKGGENKLATDILREWKTYIDPESKVKDAYKVMERERMGLLPVGSSTDLLGILDVVKLQEIMKFNKDVG